MCVTSNFETRMDEICFSVISSTKSGELSTYLKESTIKEKKLKLMVFACENACDDFTRAQIKHSAPGENLENLINSINIIVYLHDFLCFFKRTEKESRRT